MTNARHVLTILAALAVTTIHSPRAQGATWTVEKDGTGDFGIIQDAILASAPGDTVLVGPGTYADIHVDSEGMPVVIELAGGVVVRSRMGAKFTILDATTTGDRRVVTGYRGVDDVTTLEGFTVRGGDAPMGGGIYVSSGSPRFLANRIERNLAGFGAGMLCDGRGAPVIEGNEFVDNSACCGDGGGVMCSAGSSAVIRNNVFTGNFGFSGGAVGLNQADDPLVEGNRMTGNTSLAGGGLGCVVSGGTIRRNLIVGNHAEGGGGVSVWWSNGVTFTHNVVAHNDASSEGGGGYQIRGGSPELVNETISHNRSEQAAGIHMSNGASILLANCIVAFGIDGEGIFAADPQSDPLIICSDVYGNALGDYGGSVGDATGQNGNVCVDPKFCSADEADFHLEMGSPLRFHAGTADCGLIGALDGRCGPAPTGGGPREILHADPAPHGLSPYPNPMRSMLLVPLGRNASSARVDLSIFDAGGRLVRVLHADPGSERVVWDGRDTQGRAVPNGSYFVRSGKEPAAHVIVAR